MMLKIFQIFALAILLSCQLPNLSFAQISGGAFNAQNPKALSPKPEAETPQLAQSKPPAQDNAAPGPGEDQHAGYYYPEVTSQEAYGARAQPIKEASRASRIGFVTALTQQQLAKPYPPTFAIFAKGGQADRLIIVSLGDHGFHTIYQARALLAQMTAVARSTSMFRELQVEDTFTFFDLARMLGFVQLTVSDGETFAHQIHLQ